MSTLRTVENFLQKMVWPYFQSRNRDTDVENKYMGTKRGRGGGMDCEIRIYIEDTAGHKIDN